MAFYMEGPRQQVVRMRLVLWCIGDYREQRRQRDKGGQQVNCQISLSLPQSSLILATERVESILEYHPLLASSPS